MSEGERHVPSGLTERLGLRYFRRLEVRHGAGPEADPVVIDDDVIARLQQVERTGISWASAYGALSGVCCALGAIALGAIFEARPHSALAPYEWLLVMAISVVVTIIELGGLYHLSLHTAFRLAVLSGADRWPDRDQRDNFYLSLIRSGLEIPNPRTTVLGIDPLRESSRWRLVARALLYKLKRSATNLVAKAIARRVVGRSAVRGLAEFVAVPVFAVWNAIVFRWALREARLRTMSVRYVDRMVANVLPTATVLDPVSEAACLSAVAVAAVSARDLHPNRLQLLHTLVDRFTVDTAELTDDRHGFLERLPELPPVGLRACLGLLIGGVIIDGRISRRDQQLLREAFETSGMPLDLAPIRALAACMLREGWMTDARIDDALSPCTFPSEAYPPAPTEGGPLRETATVES
jgi:hypothetical protein